MFILEKFDMPMMVLDKNRKAGFTLVELTIVIFILALLTAVTMPRFVAFFSRGDLDAFASKLSTYIEHVRDEAVYKKRVLYVNYNPQQNRFWVTDFKGDKDRAVLMRAVSVPEDIVVTDFVIGDGEKIFDGDVRIPFYPGGKAEAVLIHLKGREEKNMTLEIPYLARKVKRHEGYLEKS
ncbi:MAG: type II secretion system protein [Proteobacteria bacterium]|nr:type II secretion system protein [Pseudomonadota bacterium]